MTAPAQDSPEMLAAFLRVNGELRQDQRGSDRGAGGEDVAARSCGTARSSSSATRRSRPALPITAPTSTRAKRSTSKPTSASTWRSPQHVPVAAAAAGTVVNASWLGIYGNCVIIDHGLGVQSLYGHLMSFDVKVGDTVTRGQIVGKQRLDRPGRRRSPAFHPAGRRPDGEPGRMVGSALDDRPRRAEARDAK